jgi:putative inorganic carbon (hco3(-)) transporter
MDKLLPGFLPPFLSGRLGKMSFLMLAGGIAFALVSIAAAQLLIAFAILAALLQWRKWAGHDILPAAILWPTLLLLAWTIAATLVGGGSLRDALIKKLWLFSILFLVPVFGRGAGRIRWIYLAAFAVGGVSAGYGVIQFILDPKRDPLHRIKGFMSIWMTFSGSLMLVLIGLIAFAAVYGWRKYYWAAPVSLVMAAALYLSQTRNAWLGLCLGTGMVLLLLKRFRTLILLTALIPIVYLASPADIQQRLRAGLNPADDNTRNRIELAGTALRMIEAHPWIGVGQKVSTEALNYRGTAAFPDWMYIHLHNNFLQIAGERGIPGLLLWLWFMAQLGWQAFRVLRAAGGNQDAVFAGAAAIGGWVALLTAGMFEYNFGDSEVLMVFLFMISAPLATVARDPA